MDIILFYATWNFVHNFHHADEITRRSNLNQEKNLENYELSMLITYLKKKYFTYLNFNYGNHIWILTLVFSVFFFFVIIIFEININTITKYKVCASWHLFNVIDKKIICQFFLFPLKIGECQTSTVRRLILIFFDFSFFLFCNIFMYF